MTDDDRLRLDRYELAMGLPPLGADDAVGPLPPPPSSGARAALEAAVLEALRAPPCVVSFSGGRDSSAVLALAVAVARRHGLPLPVPVTLRFPGAEGADETGWQEQVIAHLGVDDWERVCPDDIDFIGPLATATLVRHGLLWPPNTHFHAPIIEHARGGSVLTGVDGDGLFDGWRWRPLPASATRRQRVSRRWDLTVRRAAGAVPPGRRGPLARLALRPSPWIRPQAWPEVARRAMAVWEPEPDRWDRRVAWWSRRRYLSCIRWSMSLLGADVGARVVHPFLDPLFLAALARDGASRGYPDRTAAMHVLFDDVLPDPMLHRRSKAYFDHVLWGAHSRRFAASWDGRGVDALLVDPDRLRAEWGRPLPRFTAAPLLQAAWLSTLGEEG